MEISKALLKSFANITNDSGTKPANKTTYGTAMIVGTSKQVLIDGAENPIPVSLTSDIANNDRVLVTIENHEVIVTGNLTDPSASSSAVSAQGVQISQINSSFSQINSDFSQINSSFSQINSQFEQINASFLQNNSKFEQIDANFTQIGSSFTEINSSISAVNSNLSAVNSQVELNASDIKIVNSAFEIVDGHVTGLKSIDVDAATIRFADIDEASIQLLTAKQAFIDNMEAKYATIDIANVNNAWIENGVLKNASITNEKVLSVSADKLTAGTIDADVIKVVNLNADEIKTGSLIVGGLKLNLTEDTAEIDGSDIIDGTIQLKGLSVDARDAIDGVIETYQSDEIPIAGYTVSNYPASDWVVRDEEGNVDRPTTDREYKRHVGDICYVKNIANAAEGYSYRFTFDEKDNRYKWVLINDVSVLNLLQESINKYGTIGDIKNYEFKTTRWVTTTDESTGSEFVHKESIETALGDKVDVKIFNNIEQSITESVSTITTMTDRLKNFKVGARNLIRNSETLIFSDYGFTGGPRSGVIGEGVIGMMIIGAE